MTAAQHREERQPRDAQRVGPCSPHARLVDERLADIEDDRTKVAAVGSSAGRARRRSATCATNGRPTRSPPSGRAGQLLRP